MRLRPKATAIVWFLLNSYTIYSFQLRPPTRFLRQRVWVDSSTYPHEGKRWVRRRQVQSVDNSRTSYTLRVVSAPAQEPQPPASLVEDSYLKCLLALGLLPAVWGTVAPSLFHSLAVLPTSPPAQFVDFSVNFLAALILAICRAVVLAYGSIRAVDSALEGRFDETPEEAFPCPSSARAGLELTAWFTLGGLLQIVGIGMGVSASAAAFMGFLSIALVPFAERSYFHKSIPRRVWFATVLSIAGVALVMGDSAAAARTFNGIKQWRPTSSGFRVLTGFLLCLGAPVCYAGHDLRLTALGQDVAALPLAYSRQLWQLGAMATAIMASLSRTTSGSGVQSWGAFLAATPRPAAIRLFSTVGALALLRVGTCYVQNLAQPVVGTSRSQLLYAMEPLFSAAFGALFLGGALSRNCGAGGVCMALSIVLGILFSSSGSAIVKALGNASDAQRSREFLGVAQIRMALARRRLRRFFSRKKKEDTAAAPVQ